MKILSVRFLNLNSLKGEHVIRFDEPPFSESGLFAITGPTGAGKTTILDAITAALYGRVHRHNRDVSESMTRHTGESFSEVEIEVRGKAYRSKWSQRRANRKAQGELQTQQMELIDLETDKPIIAHPLAAVQQYIVDLCGLDYNQFLRSVMLSQGDFTQFLKSKESERSELLEKITDTAIYSQISKYVYDQAKSERLKFDGLKSQLENTELFTEEQIQQFNNMLGDLSAKQNEATLKIEDLNARKAWLENLERLTGAIEDQKVNLREQEALFLQYSREFEKLALHKVALEFKPALAAIETNELNRDRILSEQEKLNTSLPLLQKSWAQVQFEAVGTKSKLAAKESELKDLAPIFEQVTEIDSRIESSKIQSDRTRTLLLTAKDDLEVREKDQGLHSSRLKLIEQEIDMLKKWLQQNSSDDNLQVVITGILQYQKELLFSVNLLEKKTANIDDTQNGIDSTKKDILGLAQEIKNKNSELELKKGELLSLKLKLQNEFGNQSLEDLESIAAAFPGLINICVDQHRISVSFLQESENLTKAEQLISSLSVELALKSEMLEVLLQEKAAAEAVLEEYKKAVEAQIRIQKYEADREKLEVHQPCPLCGSMDHPYIDNHYTDKVSEAEIRRNAHILIVDQLRESCNTLMLEIKGLNEKVSAQKDVFGQTKITINALQKSFFANNILLPAPLKIESIHVINAVIGKKRTEFEDVQLKISTYRGLAVKISELEYACKDIGNVINNADTRLEFLNKQLKTLEENAAELGKEIINIRQSISEIQKSAQSLLTPFNIDEKEADIISVLERRATKYVQSNQKIQEDIVKRGELSASLRGLEQAIVEKKVVVKQLQETFQKEEEELKQIQLKRFALFGEKSVRLEREKISEDLQYLRKTEEFQTANKIEIGSKLDVSESRLKQYQQELDDQTEGIRNLYSELQERLQKKNIASVPELKTLFLVQDEYEMLASLESKISITISTGRQLIKASEEELLAENKRNLTSSSKPELLLEIQALNEQINSFNQQIGMIKQKLADNEKVKLRFSELYNEFLKQKMEYDRWLRISGLIGSESGKKFSVFAQGLTLARLTELANIHLLKLSDRYRILKSPGKDLEIQIIDAYQADVVRPMSTLSGGESFLVSLALALGLSDLASRKTQINSLFIDEGFGTLDSDTLDIAITALENLQVNGKSIGIISHVEALKERIATQIQVKKMPGGLSQIYVSSYNEPVSRKISNIIKF